MYMSTFYLDDDVEPVVSSSAPYVDDDGDTQEATVIVHPFGDRPRGGSSVSIHMSVDEAEAFGRRLLKVAQRAREHRYTDNY